MIQYSIVCIQLNVFKHYYLTLVILVNIDGFKSRKWLNSPIQLGWDPDSYKHSSLWGQSGSRSNGKEGVHHILQNPGLED